MLVLTSVDSTNLELARRVRSGKAVDGDAVRTLHQVAGRGRAGRSFVDNGGSLLLSVYRELPASSLDHIGWTTMAAALAMTRAITDVTGGEPELKWPNDLLMGGNKIGGVLGEVLEVGESVPVIIGCGVNVTSSPDIDGASSLAEQGCNLPVNAVELLARSYVEHLVDTMGHVIEGTTAEIRDAVQALCATLGTEVTLQDLAGATHTGTATDIDAEGALIVSTPAGPMPFTGVDVLR